MNVLGICGLGTVGNAVSEWARSNSVDYVQYDKYKGIGDRFDLLKADFLFLCLPTPFIKDAKMYDTSSIEETLSFLDHNKFRGLVVVRSTVVINTTSSWADEYPALHICFNPEFLTARTAVDDFKNQSHIILGRTIPPSKNIHYDEKYSALHTYLQTKFPKAKMSLVSSTAAEAMKMFVNTFYSVKIQYFTELYLTSKHFGIDFEEVRDLMLGNGWINPAHTQVPGPDGNISYGGACFTKDTQALLGQLTKLNIPHAVLESTVKERTLMRTDEINVSPTMIKRSP